jgi:NitT/TauT family transport system substrate-binding protein
MKRRILFCAGFFAFLAACAPRTTETPAIHRIHLLLTFMPNVQYAPFYVALEKSYFRQEGIEVEFDYINETDCVTQVGAGEQPFAVVSGEQVLLAREKGLPVVYAMGWWNSYPVAVVALEKSGIKTPQDLKGKKVGIPMLSGASYIGYRALLDAEGISENEMTLEAIGYTLVDTLATGKVDAAVGYANNEPIQLEALGYRVNVIRVADYVDLASNGLLTNDNILKENPDLVRGMIRAILRGVEDTIADPDGAYRISQKFVDIPPEKEPVQKQVLAATIEFWKMDKLGWSDLSAWQNMEATLRSMGLLTQALDVTKAFTNEYLP